MKAITLQNSFGIDRTFTLDQTQAAFADLEQGKHFGKIVITI